MEFEFDLDKDAQNRFKHGLAFNVAVRLFETTDHLTVSSHRLIDGEQRYKRIGPINHRLHTLVFVWRGEVCRCISFRRSNNGEEKLYRDTR